MTRTAFLLALCPAAPAQAATVQLDPGDAGVIWTAEGFRPADGLDLYSSKYTCPRVGRAWKNTATDRVMRDVRCDEPGSGGVRVSRSAGWQLWRDGSSPSRAHLPSAAGIAARKGEPEATNLRAAIRLDGRNVRKGCAGLMAPLACSALDPHPHIPPVPLPASVWLLVLALGLLWRVKA